MRNLLAAALLSAVACAPPCPANSHPYTRPDGGDFGECQADECWQPNDLNDAQAGMHPDPVCATPPVAAPELDAGAPDAGALCGPTDLWACARAVDTLSACCSGISGWAAPTAETTCERVSLGDAHPGQACKDLAAMPCAQILSASLCL